MDEKGEVIKVINPTNLLKRLVKHHSVYFFLLFSCVKPYIENQEI